MIAGLGTCRVVKAVETAATAAMIAAVITKTAAAGGGGGGSATALQDGDFERFIFSGELFKISSVKNNGVNGPDLLLAIHRFRI